LRRTTWGKPEVNPKSQAPNPKELQRAKEQGSKKKAPNSSSGLVLSSFLLQYCLGFGAWDLRFTA
jgi:hypothetical protein